MINKQNNNFGNNAVGINSTTAGYNTQTTNYGEFAAGISNKSTRAENPNTPTSVVGDKNATLFSVGCGNNTERKNAFEVKGDGSINISCVGNLQEKLKELANVHDEIILKKDPNNQLMYTLYVGDKNCGEINIPKDQFLKNVEYNNVDKKLIFTFVTTDDDNVVTEISVADLVDTYKAGNNVTIKDNTISVDFSPITAALNTKVNQSDFDYVVSVNDNNKGNVINARQIVNNQITGVSNNYDLVLGDNINMFGQPGGDSYIKIDSTRTLNRDEVYSMGNITMYSPHTIDITADNNLNLIGCAGVYIKDDPDELHSWRMRITNGFDMQCSNNDWMQFDGDSGLSVNSKHQTVFNDAGFQINSDTVENDKTFEGYFNFKGSGLVIRNRKTGSPSVNFLFAELNDELNNNYPDDKLQLLDNSIEITHKKVTMLSDDVQIKRGENIKFKTSSSNSMRLTEGEGFKVFANMYAEPDHATDIADYSGEEKAILSSDTVQKIILDLRRRVSELEIKIAALQSQESQ